MKKLKSVLLLTLLDVFLTANCAGIADNSISVAHEDDVIPSVITQI